MADADPRTRLSAAAGLDTAAAASLDALDDDTVRVLAARWDAAVDAQQSDVDAAIEGSLSLLPRIVRKQVLRILTGALV